MTYLSAARRAVMLLHATELAMSRAHGGPGDRDLTQSPAYRRRVFANAGSDVEADDAARRRKPDGDEKRATSSFETERLVFKGADDSESVLLSGGLIVDVISGNSTPGVRPFTLPTAYVSVGTDLRIGLSPKQVESLVGPTVYTPITSTLEGQPVLYATRFTRRRLSFGLTNFHR
jgi:hypothetical protein